MVDADVGAVTDHDERVHLWMGFQPRLQVGADVAADRILGHHDEPIGEGQGYQFIDRLALRRVSHPVGWVGRELDGIGVVGVLGKQEVSASQVVGALEDEVRALGRFYETNARLSVAQPAT